MAVFRAVFPLVMTLDLLLPFLLAIPYRGYSHKRMVMSLLGAKESPLRRMYNAWTVISGAVFIWAGIELFQTFHTLPVLRVLLLALTALYGLGCEIVSGLFPVEEEEGAPTPSTRIHGIGSVIGFIALLFAPLTLGIAQLRTAHAAMGAWSIACFVLAFIFFTLFVMADKPAFRQNIIGYTGLWQRVSLLWMYLPFVTWILWK